MKIFPAIFQENSGPQGHQSPRIPLHSNSREDSCDFRGLVTLPSHSDRPPLSGWVGALDLVFRALWVAQAPVQLLGVHSCWLRGAKGPGWEARVSRIWSFMLEKGQESQMDSEGWDSPSRVCRGRVGCWGGGPWAPCTPSDFSLHQF